MNDLQRRNVLTYLNIVTKNYLNKKITIKVFLHNFEVATNGMDTFEKRLMKEQFDSIIQNRADQFVDPEKLMPPQNNN